MCVSHSVVSDSATSWSAALQAPLSREFSRQGYQSGLPFHSTGLLSTLGQFLERHTRVHIKVVIMMLNEKHILIYSQIYTIPTMPTSFAVILRKFKGQLPVFSDRELSILFSKFLFIFGSAGSSFLQGFFSSCDEQGCPLDAVLRFLTAVAPLVFFFYSTGSRAQALQL